MVERMFGQFADVAAEDRSSWSPPARSARLLELLDARERVEAETLRCLGEWDAARAWAEDGAWSAAGVAGSPRPGDEVGGGAARP
jgi:hypothetical protein